MKKIVCIIGTRPQLIKHSVLTKELRKHFVVESLYTGQHYDYELYEHLKKELLAEEPFFNLHIENTEAPAERLGEMIQKIAGFLQTANANAVLVYGDTDSTLAGALAANKMRIALVHIEAGERSFNRQMPEEHNRVITDSLSDVLFCASHHAVETLTKEQCQGKVVYSGDLMKDLLLQTSQLFQTPILPETYIFCTIHRNYTNQNTNKLEALLDVLTDLNQPIVFPVHPATKPTIERVQAKRQYSSHLRLLPPVSYHDSIRYQKFAQAVITDSGGMQKEAYWLQRRCITVRRETEWKETLVGNWNQLAYDDLAQIPSLLKAPLGTHDTNLYGNGKAAACITEHLISLL